MPITSLPPTAQAYLKQALRRWEESKRLPTDDDLRQIALELEMTPQASQACDDLATELIDKAKPLLDSPDPDAAQDLLKKAILLAPLRVEPLYLLARFYADRYQAKRSPDDHARADELARRCKTLDPTDKKVKQLVDDLTDVPGQDGLSWRQAALITFILVMISGTMSVCVRFTMTPETPEGAIDEVRQYFEDQQPPP